MLGSEKQIAWANEIKLNFEILIQKNIDDAKRRVETETMPEEWYQTAIILKKNLLDTINKWTAKEIIEKREFLTFSKRHIKLFEDIENCEIKKEKMKKMFEEITK